MSLPLGSKRISELKKEVKRLNKKYKELLKDFKRCISVMSRHNDEEIDLRCAAEEKLERMSK